MKIEVSGLFGLILCAVLPTCMVCLPIYIVSCTVKEVHEANNSGHKDK